MPIVVPAGTVTAGSFTLTGRLLMNDGVTPIAGATILVRPYIPAMPDPEANKVYLGDVILETDGDGEFATPLVSLPDVYYTVLSGDNRTHIDVGPFAAPLDGATIDIADIIPLVPSPILPLDATALRAEFAAADSILNAALRADFGAGGVTAQVFNVKHPDFGALGDGTTNDTAAILAAIDACKTAGGGTVHFPTGVYLTSSTLVIDDDSVTLMGSGGGFTQNSVPDIRATAATRIVFSASATAAPMVQFTSVASTVPKTGGGCVGIMLDGNNRATRCLEIRSWRGGRFEDLFLYAATGEMLWMGTITGTLSATPYDNQFNRFVRVNTSAKNQTGNTARGAVLTGGQGATHTAAGNTSFNQFFGCQFKTNDGNALVLEDTDNNYFFGCSAGPDTGTTYGLVLGSKDQDSSGNTSTGGSSRYNQFHGGQYSGIQARAGQTGNNSSGPNLFYGLNYSNGTQPPVIEAAAGGSAAPTVLVYSSTASELLNATKVAIGANNSQAVAARAAMGTESVRISSGASAQVKLDDGGTNEWGFNINAATGDLRTTRVAGSGGVALGGTKFGANSTAPVSKPAVTGSRGGNAALASLLTALASEGLITDSSSA